MSGFRSPAPESAIFNLGAMNRRNNGATNIVGNAANKAINTVNNLANSAVISVNNVATNAVNSVGNVAINAAKNVNNVATNTANNVYKATNTVVNTVSNSVGGPPTVGPSIVQIVLIIIFIILAILIAVFWKQIETGFRIMYDKLRAALGGQVRPPPSKCESEDGCDKPHVTRKPEPPQDESNKHNIVEKILPGHQEVYNISKNAYTYYDAEPLCKALGSELASYEQVKKAYGDGADWCNYGWVKGQMAVYPTQKETWDHLQHGPEEERGACGNPGLNGGFFDNPELRFGVNCYGVKPDQKDHDATAIASGDGAPLSPGALEFDKKVTKYRGETDTIAILPFNKSKWN